MLSFMSSDQRATIDAIHKSQAVIEFDTDGNVLTANKNFLDVMGYRLDEIVGRHHSQFVAESDKNDPAYLAFWNSLRSGEFKSGEFLRIAKGGRHVWIQATYNPIVGLSGRPTKIVKFCTDITAQKLVNADFSGQIEAINRSNACIEFNLDGTIITANKNFLATVGYDLQEICGKHHSMFVLPEERNSQAYQEFWAALRRGEFRTGEFKRTGKNGKEIWLQASYNPIFDPSKTPYKVVKYCSDISAAVQDKLRRQKIVNEIDADIQKIDEALGIASNEVKSAVVTTKLTADRVQSVATAAEELVSSVSEITRRVSDAAHITERAVNMGAQTNELVDGLALSADKIGQVVELINTIATQTNLLALNATIEAARAGEAGQGFAVVANEVKTLASQTSKATSDIRSQIDAVKAAITNAVSAIKEITVEVSNINEISNSIAAAVEQQGAVTQEISRNMHSAAESVKKITDSVSDISSMTERVAGATVKVKGASVALVA